MEFHETDRRMTRSLAKRRKPLADLTNSDAGSIWIDASSCLGDEAGSTAAAAAAGGDDPPSPFTPFPNSVATEDGNDAEKREVSIIYSRRRRRKAKKSKRKEPAPAASCPPEGRRRSTKQKELMEDVNLQSKAHSVPYENRKKEKKFTLPQDLIEKQRAYFAEVDAHELLVEEVSECELD